MKGLCIAVDSKDKLELGLHLLEYTSGFECVDTHHFGGDWSFKDCPHHTTTFTIEHLTEEGCARVVSKIRKKLPNLDFVFKPNGP